MPRRRMPRPCKDRKQDNDGIAMRKDLMTGIHGLSSTQEREHAKQFNSRGRYGADTDKNKTYQDFEPK